MKKVNKSLMAIAMAVSCASSFAASSSAGIDPTGEGVIHINGTAVGSCAVQNLTVDLGDVDPYVMQNGATGVYEKNIDLNVVCTNPSQSWSILPHTAKFELTGGTTNWFGVNLPTQEAVQKERDSFASVSARSVVPGTFFDASSLMSGAGTSSVQAKIILGASLPDTNEEAFGKISDNANLELYQTMAAPMGTLQARGTVSVDLPLIIMY